MSVSSVSGADITGSVNMNFFAETFPERFYSAWELQSKILPVLQPDLALEGENTGYGHLWRIFSHANTDQVRISICYNNLHVIIGGAHAGVSVGPDGATHQALEDIAIMRSLPNMTVFSPCDATQTHQAVKSAALMNKQGLFISVWA